VAPVPDRHFAKGTPSAAHEQISNDIDLRQARHGRRRVRGDGTLLAAISAGGAIGAASRYLIQTTWPTSDGAFPTGTLAINILGCALIGVLMVLTTQVWSSQRLLRPFLGTGVLGGFTTFSTYTVDIQQLVAGAHAATALVYLAITPIAALLAAWAAAAATRNMISWRTR